MPQLIKLFIPIALIAVFFPSKHSIAEESNTAQYYSGVTKRQVVNWWIEEADNVFRSPSRVSHPGSTAKLATNMEIVAQNLLRAFELEPYRVDLLFSAANAFIYNKDVEKALNLFEMIYASYPEDIDVNIYLASWYRFLGEQTAFKKHMASLQRLRPESAAQLEKLFNVIDNVAKMRLSTDLTDLDASAALVTLGYALNHDGSMHPILIARLEKTLSLAKTNPDTVIVVTGGVPKNNKTEAKLMADWLVENGISKDRIVEENYAKDTVQNALFSRYILADKNITAAVIVSSARHVRRSQALFEIASWETGPTSINYRSVIAEEVIKPDFANITNDELLGIYRDALRVFGLWSFRSEPLIER